MFVLAFYSAQIKEIRKSLGDEFPEITVGTVDSVQGQERSSVILSLVRTHHIGFYADIRRVNVAIGRVVDKLYIIGHRSFWKGQGKSAPALSKLAEIAHPIRI
jgi:DNA polymerase alpha-associated DNA helicase A